MMLPDRHPYQQRAQPISDIRKSLVRSQNPAWPPQPLQEQREWHFPAEDMAAISENETLPTDPDTHGSSGPGDAALKERSALSCGVFFRNKAIMGFIMSIVFVCGFAWIAVARGMEAKDSVVSRGMHGYDNLLAAAESLKTEDFEASAGHFKDAYADFSQADEDLTFFGRVLSDISGFIPGMSKISSGRHAIEAGKHFAAAGIPLSRIAADMASSKNSYAQGEKISFLGIIDHIREPLSLATMELEQADRELRSVRSDDIPPEKREKFISIRNDLPMILGFLKGFSQKEPLIEELLGGNGPRKYLFLLQNNHEARATGGFIGSYALLDVSNGVVRKFFVDGIFNPDGQLRENIVPPKPIQKISAAWSLHDSNWWPDFPTSAEKAIFFYEKTGGPTVDGVITLTPVSMQKLLAVVGPINLPQYGLSVDADNFIPVIQEQVEVKYDKVENKPKKILSDLSSALLEKVFASQDKETLMRVAQALVEGLNEKQILLYARHPETEALIEEAGWSGRVLDAKKDYLSVIHTNINGYKTDGVISEMIRHRAEIQEDGSVIDTVTIMRTHNGGSTPYDWWNRVNADYLRVYVPQGSQLLSAKGATWEFPPPPLDYDALGFKRDADVEREEGRMIIDEKSGTRISEDAGKTVFGAWVYVSPKESVSVEYRYRLPFRLDFNGSDGADSYSCIYQKQSGSPGSGLLATISFPEDIDPIWQTDSNLIRYGQDLVLESDLKTDRFSGAVFRSRE